MPAWVLFCCCRVLSASGLSLADTSSFAGMFSFAGGFPLSESSHLLQIHASVEGISFLRPEGAPHTSFPLLLLGRHGCCV